VKTILLITAFLTLHATGYTSRKGQAQSDLKSFESAVAMFKLNAGKPPPADAGLQALVERPRSFGPEVRWTQIMKKLPQDPWGKPYCYVVGDGFPEGYGIYSRGPDGTSATQGNDADDLNSWRQDGPGLQSHGLLLTLGIAGAGAGLVFVGFCFGAISTKRLRSEQPLASLN
jgi:type II secretion system protein G